MSAFKLLRLILVLLTVPVATASAMAGNVVIVNATGTRQFSEIQGAIDAAVDGDVLLVSGGSYSGFTVSGKGVSILAAPPGVEVRIQGRVRILNLTWQRVLLSGLTLRGSNPALQVSGNTGHVRIHDCDIEGGVTQIASAQLTDSSDVVLQNCRVQGRDAQPVGNLLGADGIRLGASQVALYDSTVSGGDSSGYPGDGGAGIRCITSSFVFASKATIEGGAGGDRGFFGLAGDGGPGIALSGSTVPLLSTTVAGGPGGYPNGYYGPLFSGTGNVLSLQGPGPRFSVPTIARDDQDVGIAVFGQPDDRVFAWFFTSATFEFMPVHKGVWTIMPNGPFLHGVAPLGVLPVSGFMDVRLPLPSLPNSVVRRRFFMQGFVVDSQGSVTLGSPRQILSLNGDSNLFWGSGNISSDPLFMNPTRNDYRLSSTSPCIDAGSNHLLAFDRFDLDGDGNRTEPVSLDLDGLPRQVEIPAVPNTVAGLSPFADMGCYERQGL